MEDVLEYISKVLKAFTKWPIMQGIMPDMPDEVITINQVDSKPPLKTFGGINCYYGIEVKTRAKVHEKAYMQIKMVEEKLNAKNDERYDIKQETPVKYEGREDKQRHEYTIRFEVFDKKGSEVP